MVKREDIICCTEGGNYTTVVLNDKHEIISSKKMKCFEDYSSDYEFFLGSINII